MGRCVPLKEPSASARYRERMNTRTNNVVGHAWLPPRAQSCVRVQERYLRAQYHSAMPAGMRERAYVRARPPYPPTKEVVEAPGARARDRVAQHRRAAHVQQPQPADARHVVGLELVRVCHGDQRGLCQPLGRAACTHTHAHTQAHTHVTLRGKEQRKVRAGAALFAVPCLLALCAWLDKYRKLNSHVRTATYNRCRAAPT